MIMSSIINETILFKLVEFFIVSVIFLSTDGITNSRKLDYGICEFTTDAPEVTVI